jgi:exosome complex component RRP40
MEGRQANDDYVHDFLDEVSRKVDSSFQPRLVFPGEDLTSVFHHSIRSGEVLKIGSGLVKDGDRIFATIPGKLNYRIPATYWVDTCRRKYIPRVGDQIVGVIEEKGVDFYSVNIFSGCTCILNRLAFEGATKRNRPELKKGDVIYAKVQAAGKDCDTELTCISSSGVKKEWSSGETVHTL